MDYQPIVEKQRNYFNTEITKSYEFRINVLNKLENIIYEYEKDLYRALKQDLGKSEMEAYETEIGYVLQSLSETKKKLKSWMKVKKVRNPIYLLDSNSFIMNEPYGVVFIMAPFNYPFQLVFTPLIGALAAGNTAIIKLSELTPNVNNIIMEMLNTSFDEEYLKVIEGDVETTTKLLQQRFDYIFFTGSVSVGKIIMKAASEYLTPITLELGGKSPVIINDSTNLNKVAQKVAWAKFMNVGQTCIAPDYILIEESLMNEFISEMKKVINVFYSNNPKINNDYGKIISLKHTNRLKKIIESSKGQLELGGEVDLDAHYVAPTIFSGITWGDCIMAEELFGPILPIIGYKKECFDTDVINEIKSREKPLALYLFSDDKIVENKVLNELSFGGGVINDTIIHVTNSNLPFGGVGYSGVGSYHGKYSFDTFSHQKSVVKKGKMINLRMMYPPYTNNKFSIIKKILK